MPKLSDAKMLGGIGAILTIIPFVSIAGWILIVFAVKYISDITSDKSMWDNFLIAAITAIVGAAAAGFIIFLGFLTAAFTFSTSAFAGLILGLAVVWVALIISAIFLRKSYEKIATHLNVNMFRTAALLYLIGAALVIVFGLGFILLFVAQILQIVAFFSIPDQMPMVQPAAQPASPSPMSPAA